MTDDSFLNFSNQIASIDEFRFNTGQTIKNLQIGFSSFGTPVTDTEGKITNAILLLHGTSGTSASWFLPSLKQFLFTKDNPLNQTQYFFIVPDGLGAGRSSKPSDGLGMNFPQYGYLDMIRALKLALEITFPLKQLHGIVGTSMGGMHTWLMSLEYPQITKKAVAIACLPYEIAGRNLLWRRIITQTLHEVINQPNLTKKDVYAIFNQVWPLFSVMTDSASHLQSIAPNRLKALHYHQQLVANAEQLNPFDMLFRLNASYDYNPLNKLSNLSIPLLQINFSDDLLTPVDVFGINSLEQLNKNITIKIIDPIDNYSLGHQNLTQGKIWGGIVDNFLL